jgi:AraC-like DNA-binding protein
LPQSGTCSTAQRLQGRLIASGGYEQYSIDGLAEMSGFSNRNSYITAFKKFKNATPSEYIRTFRAQEN